MTDDEISLRMRGDILGEKAGEQRHGLNDTQRAAVSRLFRSGGFWHALEAIYDYIEKGELRRRIADQYLTRDTYGPFSTEEMLSAKDDCLHGMQEKLIGWATDLYGCAPKAPNVRRDGKYNHGHSR